MSYVGFRPVEERPFAQGSVAARVAAYGEGSAQQALAAGAVRAAERLDVETDSLAVVRRRERIFRRLLIVADGSAAGVAALIAITAQTGYELRIGFLLVLPLIVVVAKLQGLYDQDDLVIRKSTLDELPKLVNLATLMTMLVWLSRHFIVNGAPGTKDLLKLWVFLIFFTMVGRMVARRVAARSAPVERCFFVGDLATAKRLRSKLENTKSVQLVGATAASHVELDEESLKDLVKRFEIHRLIVASSAGVAENHVVDLVRAAKAIGLRATISPGMGAVLGSSLVLDDVWGMPLLGVPRFGLSRSSGVVKRGFDLVGAGLGLLLLAPFFALIGLLIKLDSKGPMFFRQLRVGRDGELFEIIKLRTMVADAESLKTDLREHNEAEGIFKMKSDPRITRVGRVLRRTSLDELPQLINVIRGQMSLVGPRPLVVDEDELITGFDRRRLAITPGMTGSWQILGSARVPLHEMIKLDYMYVANWSLWLDVKILLRTGIVVLSRQGL
jgi:exopolysaccharide biosynthesis polyprenyl glycosylphosphotransferase